ncbi:glycoside hydrolase family 140 protein [Oscillatoria amoena NRMC-F 0135]|nr:glycoside hydrolase family 140 protein [Oscillatoria amoena NRMC-F 0135]
MCRLFSLSALVLSVSWFVSAQSLPRLRISDNQRFLVTADGKPFFYLGDTAWELFHRLNREEATHYLEDRARKGFTVVQAVGLAELDGLGAPNPYGHLPLVNGDPRQPVEAYWQHVDFIVRKANSLGIYVGFLPTWGDKWNKKWGKGPEIFTPENAEWFGEWLGKRYRNDAIIWITGGDRPVETDAHRAIIRATARGLRKGDGGAHLITFHPTGGQGSAEPFHSEPWLDFNMRQNGHITEYTGRYDKTLFDYGRTPTKPVLDGEPVYEGHPVSFKAAELGYSIAADVRRPLYWNLFNGAFGHTYGHHSVWQMWQPDREPVNNPIMPWRDALQEAGAAQMQFGRKLIESRPFLHRIPDDSVLVPGSVPNSVPGQGRYRMVATRDAQGTYAMIYTPSSKPFSVDLLKLQAADIQAWWYNPRNGEAIKLDRFRNPGAAKEFVPPELGEMLDWVLVLDDAAKNYPPPGSPLR